MSAVVAPSGGYLRGEGMAWMIGALVCSLAAYTSCSLAVQWTASFSAAVPLAFADQLPLR